MPTESWLFLFAAIGALGGVAQVVQLLLQVRVKPMDAKRQRGKEIGVPMPRANLSVSVVRLSVVAVLLGASMVLSAIGFGISFQQRPDLPKQLRDENIEATLRVWLSHFGYGIKSEKAAKPEFHWSINTPNGIHLAVYRDKEFFQYIAIQSVIVVSDDDQKLIGAMSPIQQRRIFDNVAVETFRLGADFTRVSLQQFIFTRRLPITQQLTEDAFIKAAAQSESAQQLILAVYDRSMRDGISAQP